MPDASRHCKRPALELGAPRPNRALRSLTDDRLSRRTQAVSSAALQLDARGTALAKLKRRKPCATRASH